MQIHENELPPELHRNAWVGVDLEVFDLNPKQLHRPTSGRFALLSIAHEDDVYVFNEENLVAPALNQIKDAWWIIQNAKFDIAHLRRWADISPREKLWDTMLIDRIIWGGYYDTFALDDLTRRYLYEYMDKSLQKSFSGNEISAEQLSYSAKDAWYLPIIAREQKKHTSSTDFAVWNYIDRPALFAFLDFRGFAINLQAWEELAIRNKTRQEQINNELPINPNSPKQVVEYLAKHGYLVDSSGKEVLERLAYNIQTDEEVAKVLQKVLDSRTYGKRASTYGMNFLSDYIEYDDGVPVITANYWTTGADTGRTSSDSPNMQNIPARETKEFRDCFIARPGHKLIVADYSQQEIMIVAYISGDKVLKDICNSGKDIYVLMAKEMFGKDIDKHDPLRATMKAIILGVNYGMSEYGLAKRLNIPVADAKDLLKLTYKKFPGLHEWMSKQQERNDFVFTVAGRRYHLNPYNNKSLRNALNSPVQGSAGDCMKKALGNLHSVWSSVAPIPFGVVGYIHDELVEDVPIEWVTTVAKNTENILVETANSMFPGMNFRAEVVVGDTWACK